MHSKINIHWIRRDLRFHDNRALQSALNSGYPVMCIFIFDENILQNLDAKDRRISLIYDQLLELHKQLQSLGSVLQIFHGKPMDVWKEILEKRKLHAVFCGKDYEPYAIQRDKEVAELCNEHGVGFEAVKDYVIFHENEVLNASGKPFGVYTPYMRKWKQIYLERAADLLPEFTSLDASKFWQTSPTALPALEEYGFEKVPYKPITSQPKLPGKKYEFLRDFPAENATSRLSVALRFGMVSVREIVALAHKSNEKFLNELIWREFFSQILYHYPHVENRAFRPAYDLIQWRDAPEDLATWCRGETGYPLVDAGMRELAATGNMHNRVRMITASFLVKHLLIDWRIGESWFAKHLLDFELASNNGNWQWVAGSGTDASPYFRIFNPELQQRKFDPDFEYIKKWVPEFGTKNYPAPMVEHKFARERCLKAYAVVKDWQK
ncbi:MAG: deoxyribodipyrimidine photo-lyase [Weeksellaceae bacterium]|nr:deoxyribodipyrimidine photo-lyase [Weeksellaceae bacterium]